MIEKFLQPFPAKSCQVRIGLKSNNAKAFAQVEFRVLSFVQADIVNKVAVLGGVNGRNLQNL